MSAGGPFYPFWVIFSPFLILCAAGAEPTFSPVAWNVIISGRMNKYGALNEEVVLTCRNLQTISTTGALWTEGTGQRRPVAALPERSDIVSSSDFKMLETDPNQGNFDLLVRVTPETVNRLFTCVIFAKDGIQRPQPYGGVVKLGNPPTPDPTKDPLETYSRDRRVLTGESVTLPCRPFNNNSPAIVSRVHWTLADRDGTRKMIVTWERGFSHPAAIPGYAFDSAAADNYNIFDLTVIDVKRETHHLNSYTCSMYQDHDPFDELPFDLTVYALPTSAPVVTTESNRHPPVYTTGAPRNLLSPVAWTASTQNPSVDNAATTKNPFWTGAWPGVTLRPVSNTTGKAPKFTRPAFLGSVGVVFPGGFKTTVDPDWTKETLTAEGTKKYSLIGNSVRVPCRPTFYSPDHTLAWYEKKTDGTESLIYEFPAKHAFGAAKPAYALISDEQVRKGDYDLWVVLHPENLQSVYRCQIIDGASGSTVTENAIELVEGKCLWRFKWAYCRDHYTSPNQYNQMNCRPVSGVTARPAKVEWRRSVPGTAIETIAVWTTRDGWIMSPRFISAGNPKDNVFDMKFKSELSDAWATYSCLIYGCETDATPVFSLSYDVILGGRPTPLPPTSAPVTTTPAPTSPPLLSCVPLEVLIPHFGKKFVGGAKEIWAPCRLWSADVPNSRAEWFFAPAGQEKETLVLTLPPRSGFSPPDFARFDVAGYGLGVYDAFLKVNEKTRGGRFRCVIYDGDRQVGQSEADFTPGRCPHPVVATLDPLTTYCRDRFVGAKPNDWIEMPCRALVSSAGPLIPDLVEWYWLPVGGTSCNRVVASYDARGLSHVEPGYFFSTDSAAKGIYDLKFSGRLAHDHSVFVCKLSRRGQFVAGIPYDVSYGSAPSAELSSVGVVSPAIKPKVAATRGPDVMLPAIDADSFARARPFSRPDVWVASQPLNQTGPPNLALRADRYYLVGLPVEASAYVQCTLPDESATLKWTMNGKKYAELNQGEATFRDFTEVLYRFDLPRDAPASEKGFLTLSAEACARPPKGVEQEGDDAWCQGASLQALIVERPAVNVTFNATDQSVRCSATRVRDPDAVLRWIYNGAPEAFGSERSVFSPDTELGFLGYYTVRAALPLKRIYVPPGNKGDQYECRLLAYEKHVFASSAVYDRAVLPTLSEQGIIALTAALAVAGTAAIILTAVALAMTLA